MTEHEPTPHHPRQISTKLIYWLGALTIAGVLAWGLWDILAGPNALGAWCLGDVYACNVMEPEPDTRLAP